MAAFPRVEHYPTDLPGSPEAILFPVDERTMFERDTSGNDLDTKRPGSGHCPSPA